MYLFLVVRAVVIDNLKGYIILTSTTDILIDLWKLYYTVLFYVLNYVSYREVGLLQVQLQQRENIM